jgi:hypothetical protein
MDLAFTTDAVRQPFEASTSFSGLRTSTCEKLDGSVLKFPLGRKKSPNESGAGPWAIVRQRLTYPPPLARSASSESCRPRNSARFLPQQSACQLHSEEPTYDRRSGRPAMGQNQTRNVSLFTSRSTGLCFNVNRKVVRSLGEQMATYSIQRRNFSCLISGSPLRARTSPALRIFRDICNSL